MATESVLGMDDDEVDRAVTQHLMVPTVAAPRPRCCGATTWMAGWWGGGVRGSVASLGVAGRSTRPGVSAHSGRACDRGGQRTAVRPRLSAIAAAVPVGGRRGRRWSNSLTRTLWSMAVRVLLMLFSSGVSAPASAAGEVVMVPPARTTSPVASTSSRASAPPVALVVAGGGVFEVDG